MFLSWQNIWWVSENRRFSLFQAEATVCIAGKSNFYCDFSRKKEAWADQEVVEIPLTEGTLGKQ